MARLSTLIVGVLLAAASHAALAQSAAPPAGSTDAIPEKVLPDTDMKGKGGTLSDKLNQSGGVIHPKGDVDPGIGKPAPAVGTMPVVPPPGSPGGAGDVQPK